MRVGVVIGSGGIPGAAWAVGALQALEETTGLGAAGAERLVGTSAGAIVASAHASGVPAEEMVAFSDGHPFVGAGGPEGLALRGLVGGPRSVPRPVPSSLRLGLRGRRDPLALACGLLPRGCFSTAGVEELVRRCAPGGWPHGVRLEVAALDLHRGERVVLGPRDAPLPRAVAASCAIPGVFAPVPVGGRELIDGGVRSGTNADLLAGAGLDVVVILAPGVPQAPARGPWARLHHALRRPRERLAAEVAALERSGTRTVVLRPAPGDAALMRGAVRGHGRAGLVLARARAHVHALAGAPRRAGAPALGALAGG